MVNIRAEAAGIFADAWEMRQSALDRLAAGDIRDAAEKAWCATLRATEALVLARAGHEPYRSTAATRRLRDIAEAGPSLRDFWLSYLERQEVLHGQCFYHNDCQPVATERLIRETADYLRDAERLAGT